MFQPEFMKHVKQNLKKSPKFMQFTKKINKAFSTGRGNVNIAS